MLLNFCLGCKKKKVPSSFSDDRFESTENVCLPKTCKSANSRTNNKSTAKSANSKTKSNHDQVDSCQAATSPSSICKFPNDSLSTPVAMHSVNTDGSIRIKTNAINRALPDIPINDLVNTSINSTASAILNRSIDRSLTPPTSFNCITNLPINQSNDNSSLKYSCVQTTSTFNPTIHSSKQQAIQNAQQQQQQIGGTTLSNSQSQSLNDLNENDPNKSEKREHHSYARIKDNVVIDSSTENDTDDYYDSSVLGKRGLELQKVTINVPSATNQHLNNNLNHNQLNVNSSSSSANEPTTSLYAVSSNLNMITNLELPYHITNISTITCTVTNLNSNSFMNTNYTNSNFNSNTNTTNVYDLSADEEPTKEVSYNKISVREPLAKVLADRAALIEHHYTEVYDENNSFYEEIAGSTNSSVTYTKIGDLVSTNSPLSQHNNLSLTSNLSMSNHLIPTNPIPPPTTSPPPIPVETSLLTIKHSSRSTSPMQNVPILQTFLPNSNLITNNSYSSAISTSAQQPIVNCEALYTQVNKLTKTNKKLLPMPPNQQQPNLNININDLYAKVQKNLKIQQPNDDKLRSSPNYENNQRKVHSSTPDMNNAPPPPLPSLDKIPKNPKTNLFTIKSNTNLNHSTPENTASTSGYGQQYNHLNVYPQHKRSFSSGSQYQDNDSDYYETFPDSKLTDNHSYETVKKKSNDKLDVNDEEIIDAGYEIINYSTTNSNKKDENSDEDSPCYETIVAPAKQNSSDELDEYISEPDYEVIKNENTSKQASFKSDHLKLSRKESDVSTDPGYERILDYGRSSKKARIDEIRDEVDYEVVNDPNHFIERL